MKSLGTSPAARLVRRVLHWPFGAYRRLTREPDPFSHRTSDGHPARPPYSGQYGQDEIIHKEFFGSQRNLTFVDIGAHDGVSFNNTVFFERDLGWSGLCVEPIPEVFDDLKKNRTARCVHAAVSVVGSNNKFLRVRGYAEMLSGILDSQDSRHLERIEREVREMGGSVETIPVTTIRLDALLADAGIASIDLLCIDVEGAEVNVLNSFDLAGSRPSVVCLENNYLDPRLWKIMKRAGYHPYQRIKQDEIYFQPDKFPNRKAKD